MSEIARRDFLTLSSSVFASIGTGAFLWPFVDQMNPDTLAKSLATTEVDLKPVPPGQGITVLWRGKAVFVRHRTSEEIAESKAVSADALLDPHARNAMLAEAAPASDSNRTLAGHEQWLVLVGVCTHAGCVPRKQSGFELQAGPGGWMCPCHFSLYDAAGRVRRGPAPQNLAVPPYRFLSDTRLVIG